MKQAILRMLRWGRSYDILLACGHQITASQDEIAREQWYIGRPVRCAACEREERD